jgi:hypothetical protein
MIVPEVSIMVPRKKYNSPKEMKRQESKELKKRDSITFPTQNFVIKFDNYENILKYTVSKFARCSSDPY